tara:strand:- start:3982 stop:4434 length:453 start_codon:yes stop_codon:yes gene_type:complete
MKEGTTQKMNQQKRFVDNGDGTVTDREMKVMWKQTDGFQDNSKFMNWYDCRDYVLRLNDEKFAGYADWRFPDLEEAQALYEPDKHIRDLDRFEIFIDSSFSPGGGSSTWTSEERPYGNAAVFYYRYGYEDLAHKEGMSRDTVRAVRSIVD